MPHLRTRFALQSLKKLARLWPVVGLIGPRQSGKTTLMHQLLGVSSIVSFDDFQAREEASRSPREFLGKLSSPVALDEVQKSPEIFDAIKLKVDRKRVPGQFFLTGSSEFSARSQIRESLTGRIGLTELFPMSLAELHQKPKKEGLFLPSEIQNQTIRFPVEKVIQASLTGGMPIPAFLRDPDSRNLYWRSWLDTTLLRDLPRLFKTRYDPDFAYQILNRIGAVLREGELPALNHFSGGSRKIRNYLSAMQEIFLLRKISCHEEGTGKEVWMVMDAGLATHLMAQTQGEGATLSLIRHFLWNEWANHFETSFERMPRVYYKSAQGSPVDGVFNGVPVRIVASSTSIHRQLKWEERPLLGAMKKLGSKVGYLIGPTDSIQPPPKKGGIGLLPWGYWS